MSVNIQHLRDDPAVWRVLEERAQALAIQDLATQTDLGESCLTFQLGQGSYSIPARFIREVQQLGNCTSLPHTPPFIVGLANIHGRLLTVLDIRPLLELPQNPPLSNGFLLVLTINGVEVGLLADVVVEIRHSADDLMPMISTAGGHAIAWVRGVDKHFNLQLDPVLLLNDSRLTSTNAN
jgi:purine-binding chemotaxis protein CheW